MLFLFAVKMIRNSRAVFDVMQFHPTCDEEEFFNPRGFWWKFLWRHFRVKHLCFLKNMLTLINFTKKLMWVIFHPRSSCIVSHDASATRSTTLNSFHARQKVILVNRFESWCAIQADAWESITSIHNMLLIFASEERHRNHNGLMALIILFLIPKPHHMCLITCCCYVSGIKCGEGTTKEEIKLRIILWMEKRENENIMNGLLRMAL